MTIDQLEVFIAIVENGGLHAASKVLHKTQPTLSVSMKKLEQELGLEVLDRSSYRVKPTSSGKILLSKAKEVLAKVKELETSAKELAMGKEPFIKLAIDYLCPMNSILGSINQFSVNCRDTKIEMDFEVLSGAENKVLNSEANIAITPFISKHSKILSEKLCDIEIIPVIAKRQKLNKSDFLQIPQIIVKDTSSEQSGGISFAADSESPKYLVSDHHIKRELIINGFGWGHLEKSSISNELKNKVLKKITQKGFKDQKIPLYIVRSKQNATGPVTNDLWDYLLKKFNK